MRTKESEKCCDRPVRGSGGHNLCPGCRGRLAAALRDLPGLYAECATALGRGPADGLREKVSGGPLPGLALNTGAADARSAVLRTLAGWAARVARERRVPAPRRLVPGLAAFLLANLDWLSCHPDAVRIGAEVTRTARAAHRAGSADTVKRVEVGRCVATGCAGTLSVTMRSGQSRAQVRCGTDPGHAWDRTQWTSLRRQMPAAAGDRWLTAADIARLWHTPAGTVYRLAGEQSWHRVARAGRTYYAEADVHATFARRELRR